MHPEPRGQTVVSTSTRTKPQCSHAISGRGKELKWGDLSATVDNTKEARIYQICVYFSSDINIYASCPRLHKSSKSFELRSSGLLPPAGLCDKNISEQNTFYGGSLLSVADKKSWMKCECLGMCLITTDCCWSLSTGNALWVILVALMTEPRWTGGSHWMEYFSCSQWNIFLVWFWEIIRAVIFALCPSRAQQIFDLPRCSETRNTWGNSNSFLLRCCWKLLYFYQPDIFSSH